MLFFEVLADTDSTFIVTMMSGICEEDIPFRFVLMGSMQSEMSTRSHQKKHGQ